MKRVYQYFLALALLASPFAFTSCDNALLDDDYYYNDLVTHAVNNYRFDFPNGTDYYTTYNWFYYNYPEATNSEFYEFMRIVGLDRTAYWNNYNNGNYNWNNNNTSRQDDQNDNLLAEAQTLTGEWEGSMSYEYTDDSTKQRKRDKYQANMKFFQYDSSKNSLGGNGVEVDTDAQGNTQTLEFSWYVNSDGSIYIRYTRSGTVFVLDARSNTNGFHLGYDSTRGYDTFYGTGYSTNTTDVFTIDLSRQRPATARSLSSLSTRALATQSFGKTETNNYAKNSEGAVNRLHVR